MIFRPTRKLAHKLKIEDLPVQPAADNPHADWSANLFTSDRRQYMLIVHTRALVTTVIPGRGISDTRSFTHAALVAIEQLLRRVGHASVFKSHVLPAAEDVTFARTLNRSITGTLNDMTHCTKYCMQRGDDLTTISHMLTITPYSALGERPSDLEFPLDEMKRLCRNAD